MELYQIKWKNVLGRYQASTDCIFYKSTNVCMGPPFYSQAVFELGLQLSRKFPWQNSTQDSEYEHKYNNSTRMMLDSSLCSEFRFCSFSHMYAIYTQSEGELAIRRTYHLLDIYGQANFTTYKNTPKMKRKEARNRKRQGKRKL